MAFGIWLGNVCRRNEHRRVGFPFFLLPESTRKDRSAAFFGQKLKFLHDMGKGGSVQGHGKSRFRPNNEIHVFRQVFRKAVIRIEAAIKAGIAPLIAGENIALHRGDPYGVRFFFKRPHPDRPEQEIAGKQKDGKGSRDQAAPTGRENNKRKEYVDRQNEKIRPVNAPNGSALNEKRRPELTGAEPHPGKRQRRKRGDPLTQQKSKKKGGSRERSSMKLFREMNGETHQEEQRSVQQADPCPAQQNDQERLPL